MFAFGRVVFTVALWRAAAEDCDPAHVAGSALLQSRRKSSLTSYPFESFAFPNAGFENKTLAPHCRSRALPAAGAAPDAANLQGQILSARAAIFRMKDAACSGITLVHFEVNTSTTSCCPTSSLSCGGCAKYTSDEGCTLCLGGYDMKEGQCMACIGIPGWTNEIGQTCDAIGSAGCNDKPVNGKSSNEACCHCNGGRTSPTPFAYPDMRFAVGAAVDLKPVPRTAKRYSVNADCGFAAYNLTIDGETGAIHYAGERPEKAFSVQCEITAHQAVGVVETVKVTVAVDVMTYGASVLIFSANVQSFAVRTSADLKDYSMVCAPEAPWLSLSSTGQLSYNNGMSNGAVTDAEIADGELVGMDGAVCAVSANEKMGDGFQKRVSTFAVVKPKPWQELSYESHYIQVVVGEEVPAMKPKVPVGFEEGVGGLKPTAWHVQCTVIDELEGQASGPNWSYDSNWGIGMLGSHEILQMQPDGTISISPSEDMAKVFDEASADGLQRKSLLLNCGVWGSFPGSEFPALHVPLMIRIKDSMCWVSETFMGAVVEELHITSESSCRNNCRMSRKCSHFTYNEDKCKHYRVQSEGGTSVTALAKVTGCTDLGTCLRLKHPDWVIAGDYCPVAFQQVYTPPEVVAVAANIAVLDGPFEKQGDHVRQTSTHGCYSVSDESCGKMEFKLSCSRETKVKLKAELIAPDTYSDSFWVQIKGVGTRSAWHTGTSKSWEWCTVSPEVTASAGESTLQLWGREKLQVRGVKLSSGSAHCKFLGPSSTSRSVMYRKESSISQEVMYLGKAGASGCVSGEWLVQRPSPHDFVDDAAGYFDVRGDEMLCLGAGLPSSVGDISLDYATMACARPLFPEVEEQLQPLVFDEPSTAQPDDFWLHPCDCLPTDWGMNWPADASALENIPAGSNGSFIPPPFLIVSGQFACPSRQLLKGAAGIHFESEAEAMERSDCEERCKDYKDCLFYWTGSSHGAQTCRLYSGCDSLVREFGMEGDLMALPHNVSCQVANPEGCWKTSLRKQFLTQKQGTSPSFTRGAVVMNVGGARSWTGNSTGSKDRDTTYIEPFGDMSTIKLLGWSYMQRNAGFVRDVPGIATVVVQGLNPNKNYKYTIKQITALPVQNNKLTVNHGSPQTMVQFSRRRSSLSNAQGTLAATPRGELVFDFEAVNYPLNSHVRTSGTSGGTASTSCRRRYKITSCNCFAESGICAGSKVHSSNCYAYGTMDVSGTTGKSITVRAKAQCMELHWSKAYSVVNSGGASFSFLETVNESLDEGDREVSLDAVGKARDEDEEESLETLESDTDEDTTDDEAERSEDSEDLQDEASDEASDEDSVMEDSAEEDLQVNHSMSLLEEGASSASGSQGWRRRRRRRRRRRTRRRRSRRRRSRRRRSRRRRTLPASVSASCPSGRQVLSCNCYPDSFTEKAHSWTITHHCKEVWMSGRTCYAKGGYAQAICGEIPEPAARSWTTREASGSYWTNKDEGPAASCPSNFVVTGCWCSSSTGRGDNCVKVWPDGNVCRARTSGNRAHTSTQSIKVTARCAEMATAVVILSNLKIELQEASLMETPVVEARSIGHLAPLSFHYMHLHQQCDSLLLMGGIGVEHCSRPSYRVPNYHPWEGKKLLPRSFVHGSQLSVSCWKERFTSFRGKVKLHQETLHCVNGDWYNQVQTPELGKFTCEPCVLVGGEGYMKYDKRNEQELYFFSRLAMRVFTELGSVVETSAAAHKFCLKKDPSMANGMTLVNEQECPEILAIQLAGNSEIQERMMLLLDEGVPDHQQCLEAVPATDGVSASVRHETCDVEKVQQTISPMALPSIMWNMHKDADRNSGEDLHSAFSSYCGAHGALSRLSFGQIFGGVIDGVMSYCHFAPVIKFGTFVDSSITYDKTSSNWPDWNTLLADSPILCADGEALTGFKHQPASNKFRYECSRIGGLGASYEYFSAQVEVKAFDANRANFIESLKMINIDCGMNGLLSGFHFEFSEGGRWARSKYTCSKAGGAPVVMEPSTLIEPLVQGTEGVFCPAVLDAYTGRFEYENVVTGDMLTFGRDGRWCVGSDCSEGLGGATPVGVTMATHQVVNVTDFDGHFEAKGVPKMGEGGPGDLAKKLKALKPPKRPAQPKKPSLQQFKATQPQYAEECLDYQDLWKKITETHVNEEKEEVVEDAKLEADPGTEGQELLEYHPCAVAHGAGGIFGRLAGQSGQLAPENMLYSDWNDCMQGDINRALLSAKVDFAHAIFDLITGPVHEGIEMVCNVIPDVEIAPLGAGIQVEPKSICEELADFIDMMGGLPVDFEHERFNYLLEEEGFNACNPFQVGFSRVFCDIHCVRDAVIRGDRTIIKNLEKATKISNDNMKKMVEWSTEANRVETEYLDKKIDHSLKVNTIYLEHIAQNTAPELMLKNTAAAMQAMMKELRGYAEAASFSKEGLRRARGALENFISSTRPLEASNVTERLRATEHFHAQVQSLHDSMLTSSAGMRHTEVVGRQISSEVQKLQHRFSAHERVLGLYRTHHQKAHHASKHWKRESSKALVTLDHLWWRMRKHLDSYMDAAETELHHFRASFTALSNYENCKSGFEDLLKSYASSMSKMKRSHKKLKVTWREVNNLLGELSAVIRDGDYFASFIGVEGCGSPLAKQTLEQARFAVQGMAFLLQRFQAASLPLPDVTTLKSSTGQIRKAYLAATKHCQHA